VAGTKATTAGAVKAANYGPEQPEHLLVTPVRASVFFGRGSAHLELTTIRRCRTVDTLKRHLKTHLFRQS